LAGYAAVAVYAHGERTIVLLLAAVGLGGFLLLQLRLERLESDGGQGLLWPAEWLAGLRPIDRPVHVATARFYDDTGPAEDDAWRRWRVGDRIARVLGRSGKATLIEPGLLAWCEPVKGRQAIDERSLPSLSGGLLRWVGSSS